MNKLSFIHVNWLVNLIGLLTGYLLLNWQVNSLINQLTVVTFVKTSLNVIQKVGWVWNSVFILSHKAEVWVCWCAGSQSKTGTNQTHTRSGSGLQGSKLWTWCKPELTQSQKTWSRTMWIPEQYSPVESSRELQFLCGLWVSECQQNSSDSFAQFECLTRDNKIKRKHSLILFYFMSIIWWVFIFYCKNWNWGSLITINWFTGSPSDQDQDQ